MEREEGELTDEDLEDVSDNSSELSIPIALAGKSPLREPFREISLTSISDDSDSLLLEKTSYRHISRDLYRKHSHKHRRDEKLQSSTKRARRFSEKRKQRKSSLHRKDYSSVTSSSDEANYKNKTILRQLRDAVRINRSQNLPNCSLRTRLKRMIEPASQTSNSSDDDNLEILRDQALQSKTKCDQNPKESTENSVNDEDLAQLRLIALKSAVIKKHAERRKRKEEQLKQEQKNAQENDENITQPEQQQQTNNVANAASNNQPIEEDEDILRAMLLTSISRKIADKKIVKQQQTNVLNNKNGALPNKPTVQKTNENNYKLPTTPLNRFIIKVNDDSETDSDQNETHAAQKPQINPKSDIFDKSLSLFLQQARAKTEEEKTKHQSDISHLPRSQQIEYKRLKRKLQILTRLKPVNSKMRKISGPDENKKLHNTNVNSNSKYIAKAAEKTHKDDRLMIKGKYEELTPLMSRVSEARIARDKTQADVKRLINNLKIARAQLTANHQEYTVLVQELVKAKADIDKRAENQEKNNKIRTSTPNKLTVKENNNPTIVQETPVPVENEIHPVENEIHPAENEIPPAENEIPITEMMDIVDVVETVPELNYKKEATILKYNSPLEHIQLTRKQPLQNPLLELCPYDLLGVCRDADCSYQHCGNNTS